ncbi:hypothetical protein SAMN06269117_11465 [Balnearium lithotrophicum]|uniref:DUF2460 domain-containing protein n=1 Tax=Balnearium lithotrophicum TaxID=223788 RepID=A0A521CTM6_9BACT|nr:DUF2460 domain-containing protein [Balnearium lithotrophicum]SMO62000.1 hypothetical protein SAMN06269117_11465 [Balnearium lithotrophicum]
MKFYPTEIPSLPNGTLKTVTFKTLVSNLENGREFRRRKWLFPKRSFRLKYDVLTQEQADTLWNFFIEHQGAYKPFLFQFPYKTKHYNEFVAQADGSQKVFDLPSKDAQDVVIYFDGNPVGGFFFLPEGGEYGKDRVEFKEPPPAGALITADFYGYLVITARFAEDSLSSEIFKAYLQRVGIGIVEVR